MKLHLLILFLFLGILTNAKDNKEYITINVHFSAPGSIRFRYYDDFLVEKTLSFRNTIKRDTIIAHKVYSNYILEFRYSVFNVQTNEHYFNIFYAKKGDNINLQLKELSLKNIGDNQLLFINEFLKIDDSIFGMGNGDENLQLKTQINKEERNSNLKVIDSLFSLKRLNDSTVNLFTQAAYNAYYTKQTRLNYPSESPYLDTIILDLKQILAKKTIINSSFLNGAIHAVLNYNRIKGKLNSELNAFVKQAIDIETEKRYKTGIAFKVLNDFPEKTSKIYAESYRLFLDKLSDSAFLIQDYAAKIVPNKTEFDRTNVKLVNTNKQPLNLEDIFKRNKGKWIVFDFWASWCIPCINEFPYLENAKVKLKDRNIVFIGMGLDKDNKEKDWVAILNKAKISNQNQFRVIEKSNKAISQLYKIETIPRYLVFDTKGMLINDQFPKPSSKDFVDKLLRYLNTF